MSHLDLFPRHRIIFVLRRHVGPGGSATVGLRRLANQTGLTENEIVALLTTLPLDGETVHLSSNGKTVHYQLERSSRSGDRL